MRKILIVLILATITLTAQITSFADDDDERLY